jgi:NADH-quinone oxidoreductase subunit H
MNTILAYIFFPGFLFTATGGLLVHWIDRKIAARIQWRVGPPILQPVYDLLKLLGKETMVPKGSSQSLFLLSPLVGLVTVTLVSTIVWISALRPEKGFIGDLVVVIYFLMVPSIALMIGGFASRNPIASLGSSREMKLMLADELPFILAVFVPVIQAGGTIRLEQILGYQQTYGMVIGSISGFLAFVAAFISVQAKLSLVPFDIPEAETEIMGGPYVEYSGPPLAVFKLTRMMMQFTLPLVLVILFLGGVDFHGWSILYSILKLGVLILLISLVRNTNPRVRIDQAVKFFWGPVTFIAILAVVLALLGL